MYSNIKLGIEHEVDFAFFDNGSVGPEWNVVEIEAPKRKPFKKSGEPTAWLTHAIEQVRDWMRWVHHNLDYARKLLPHIEYPLGYVFMGRRGELTNASSDKLRRLVFDNRSFLRIHSLDRLADAASSAKSLLPGGGWTVPMRAFSHTDLAKGRPEYAWEWLRNPRQEHDNAAYVAERRKSREANLGV